jgi:hypothetical protein
LDGSEYHILITVISTFLFRPKVKVEKKEDKKPAWGSVAKPEVKAKVGSRIDTNMVKLKLLDATRKVKKKKKLLTKRKRKN